MFLIILRFYPMGILLRIELWNTENKIKMSAIFTEPRNDIHKKVLFFCFVFFFVVLFFRMACSYTNVNNKCFTTLINLVKIQTMIRNVQYMTIIFSEESNSLKTKHLFHSHNHSYAKNSLVVNLVFHHIEILLIFYLVVKSYQL
jgi:hypothetical protein